MMSVTNCHTNFAVIEQSFHFKFKLLEWLMHYYRSVLFCKPSGLSIGVVVGGGLDDMVVVY